MTQSLPLRSPVARFSAAVDRLIARLADPAHGDRTAAIVLIAYALIWTLYGVLAKGSQDIHFDMGEALSWSRELALGYAKHPPMSAWIVWLWFSIWPLAGWSYYLLAMAMSALAIWFGWKLAGDYLQGHKRVLALAFLTLVPFYNFHALTYSANEVLLPFWAAATFYFLRSIRGRSLVDAILAGLAGGGAMLGKYWSATLVLGLGLAAILDKGRRAYFASPAPWLTLIVGAAVFAPNVIWLAQHDFASLGYAAGAHPTSGPLDAAGRSVSFVFGFLAYCLLPILLTIYVAWPLRAALADMAAPADPDRRTALWAFLLPLLIPVPLAIATSLALTPIWMIPAASLLPVCLLSSPRLQVSARRVRHAVTFALLFPLIATAVAPLAALQIHAAGKLKNALAYYHLLADEVETRWSALSAAPLPFISGQLEIATGTLFYLHGEPVALAPERMQEPADLARVEREGIVIVCVVDDPVCDRVLASIPDGAARAHRDQVELTRTYLGIAGKPQRFDIIIISPAR